MKQSVPVALIALFLLSVADANAADCASALTATHNMPPRALPTACRTMGPFRLGMSYAQMVAAMGRPDATAIPAIGYRDAVYVFPRDLATELGRHPVPQRDVHFGTVEVVFFNGKAAVVSAFVPPPIVFSYSIGGVAIGGDARSLLARVKTPAEWNASRDHVGFDPYPMGVDVGADGRIIGVTIAKGMNPHPGHAVRFQWVTNLTTGLVRGYRVSVGPQAFAHRQTAR